MERSRIAEATERERHILVADLKALDADAWDTPSLCEGWTVRDVVAHIARVGDFYARPYTFEWDLIRYGFRLHRSLSEVARRQARDRSPHELLERLEASGYEKTTAFRLHPQPHFALNEWIVHGQDIRRPLGLRATFRADELIACAETSMKWYAWGSRERKLKVRLEATDAEFAVGEGPLYRGPLEAITMVIEGRMTAMDDLTPG